MTVGEASVTRLMSRPVQDPPDLSGWRWPAMTDETLDNGVRLVQVPLPGRGLVAVRVFLQAPLAGEERPGLHALVCALLTEGTQDLDTAQLAAALARCGAVVSPVAGVLGVVLQIDAPVHRLADAMTLAGQVLTRPRFAPRDVSRLLAEGRAAWAQRQHDPGARADLELQSIVHPAGHRLRLPVEGTPDALGNVTVDQLVATHERIVAAPRACVVVAGDLAGLDVRALVADAFGGLPLAGPVVPAEAAAPGPEPTTRAVPRTQAVQTVLRWGRVTTGLDDATRALGLVAARVLGGSMDSRLNQALRQEGGHTYGARCEVTRVGPDAAQFGIQTAVDAAATAECVATVERIVRELLADGASANEVATSSRVILTSRILGLTSSAAFAGPVLELLIDDRSPDAVDEWSATISAATPDTVDAAVRTMLADGRLCRVAVGPPDALAALDGAAARSIDQFVPTQAHPRGPVMTGSARGRRVAVTATGRAVTTTDDGTTFDAELQVQVSDGWYVYPPDSSDGVPVSVTGRDDVDVDTVELISPAEPHLTGTVRLRVHGRGPDHTAAALVLRAQACDGRTCEMPERLQLTVPLEA